MKRNFFTVFSFFILFVLSFSSCHTPVGRAFRYNFPGFQDYEILPYRTVAASSEPQELPYSECFDPYISEEMDKLLQKMHTSAILVLHNDSIVAEWYDEGISDTSFYNTFSLTKSIMSILTGIALKEGKIKSISEPISNYYVPYQENGRDCITFEHLLRMQSGLKYTDHYFNPFSKSLAIYYGKDLHDFACELEPRAEPGAESFYRNCDAAVLSVALHNAVGVDLSTYAHEKLWQPLGATQDARWLLDEENGNEKGFCCLHTNVKDLARVGILHKNLGYYNGKQILDSAYVKQSLVPSKINNRFNEVLDYGFGWWLDDYSGKGDYSAHGALGQWMVIVPHKNLIFVHFGKWDNYRFRKDFFDLIVNTYAPDTY